VRRRVVGCQELPFRKLRETEVQDLDEPVLPQHHVLGLDVTVRDPGAVRRSERAHGPARGQVRHEFGYRAQDSLPVRSASAAEPQPEATPPEEAPPAAFAPMRSEAGALDLMSGRGLY